MMLRKCLTAFLILLLFSPLIPLVYAGGGDEPVIEHPWEELQSGMPPTIQHPNPVWYGNKLYFFSIRLFNSGIFIVTIEKKTQEQGIKKEQSESKISLPRKR